MQSYLNAQTSCPAFFVAAALDRRQRRWTLRTSGYRKIWTTSKRLSVRLLNLIISMDLMTHSSTKQKWRISQRMHVRHAHPHCCSAFACSSRYARCITGFAKEETQGACNFGAADVHAPRCARSLPREGATRCSPASATRAANPVMKQVRLMPAARVIENIHV